MTPPIPPPLSSPSHSLSLPQDNEQSLDALARRPLEDRGPDEPQVPEEHVMERLSLIRECVAKFQEFSERLATPRLWEMYATFCFGQLKHGASSSRQTVGLGGWIAPAKMWVKLTAAHPIPSAPSLWTLSLRPAAARMRATWHHPWSTKSGSVLPSPCFLVMFSFSFPRSPLHTFRRWWSCRWPACPHPWMQLSSARQGGISASLSSVAHGLGCEGECKLTFRALALFRQTPALCRRMADVSAGDSLHSAGRGCLRFSGFCAAVRKAPQVSNLPVAAAALP